MSELSPLLDLLPRTSLIVGKGGVGKTTCAVEIARLFARRGERTLLMSTDPAAALATVLDSPVSTEIAAVSGEPNLDARQLSAAELRRGVAANERYYTGLEEALRASGQGWLDLTYEKLGGLEERGRALRFLGVADRPELLAGATRRQNPQALSELMEGFDRLAAELAGTDLEAELREAPA